jgi:hypothetical protein
MLNCNLSRDFVRRSLALAAVLGTGIALSVTPALAQTVAAATDDAPTTVHAQAAFSTSADQTAPTLEASLLPANPFGDPMQYGGGQRGRRTGGRPRYRGANTNPDGSNKYIFYAGAGFQQTIGNTFHYLTPSWALQVGGGRQFNQHFAVPVEFDWDQFGFTGQNLANESYIYTGDGNPSDNGIDANSHIWSFSVDPTYTFLQGEKWGAYGVVGAGFYHKVANLTAPQTGVECYYYCEQIEYQGNFAHFTSNAPGFSGGFGLTYKFSRFSNERFYAEARYVFIDNAQRTGATVANATTYTGYNGYPANSNRTTYIPIKFGIRF